jgi:SAM-dependent methyltransferase
MSLVTGVLRWTPTRVKESLKRVLAEQIRLNSEPLDSGRILSALYSPVGEPIGEPDRQRLTWSRRRVPARSPDDPLPIPPPQLRMGYARDSEQFYLSWGEGTANSLREALARHRIRLAPGAALLEWGRASGRVLRHFAQEARKGDVWGTDVDGAHLMWAKENLSPPFRFLTCTAYPHLPFEDGTFALVYGISVFTHIYHLLDMWLMEIRRILAPGGCALVTIHDEHSWQWLRENWATSTLWHGLLSEEEIGKGLTDDVCVLARGRSGAWSHLQTFYRTDWIQQEWGRYLDVLAIVPRFEYYQSLVILRKPGLVGA